MSKSTKRNKAKKSRINNKTPFSKTGFTISPEEEYSLIYEIPGNDDTFICTFTGKEIEKTAKNTIKELKNMENIFGKIDPIEVTLSYVQCWGKFNIDRKLFDKLSSSWRFQKKRVSLASKNDWQSIQMIDSFIKTFMYLKLTSREVKSKDPKTNKHVNTIHIYDFDYNSEKCVNCFKQTWKDQQISQEKKFKTWEDFKSYTDGGYIIELNYGKTIKVAI